MQALPARVWILYNSVLRAEASTCLSSYPLFTPICIPLSQKIILNTYEVPDDNQPNIKRLAKVYSNVNSSVYPLIPNKNAPTQKPRHIEQRNNSPNLPLEGRIESNMDPYTKICVKPKAASTKYKRSILCPIHDTHAIWTTDPAWTD